jgi:hypothetical protein
MNSSDEVKQDADIERLRDTADGARSVADGHTEVLADAANIEAAADELETLQAQLAECYRLTGEDPDGAPDSMLAEHAVEAVREMRTLHDEQGAQELALREKAEQKLSALQEAVDFEVGCMEHYAEEKGGMLGKLAGEMAEPLRAALDSSREDGRSDG